MTNSLFACQVDVKAQLLIATDEALSAERVDTELLAEICALQLKIGELDSAKKTLSQILANSDDGGGYTGPLYKLTLLVNKQSSPDQFDSLITFFHESDLGVDPQRESTKFIDQLIGRMIADAADNRDLKLAKSLLSRLSEPPELCQAHSEDHDTVQGALWINLPLVQEDGNIEESLKVAALFKDEVARTMVCKDIYQVSYFSEEVETQINEFLKDVGPEAELHWCRERLNVAIGNSALWDEDREERADGTKAAKMLRRMVELGLKDRDYLYPKVAEQLRREGKTKEAMEFLISGEESVRQNETETDQRSIAKDMLAEQFGESGEIDKAIELSAHWSRHDVSSRSAGLNPFYQPLYELSHKLAKAGRLEEATRVASSIQDNYWRTIAINNVGERFRRKDKNVWLEYAQRAREEAAKISPLEDRQWALRKIISSQVLYEEMTFEEVVKALEPLSARARSSILGEKMEYLLKEEMPMKQIKKAISIIEAGDTMALHTTAEKLLDLGHEELAVETILKIKLEYDFEFYLHNFFAKVRPGWDLDQQLAFVSKAQFAERPELIFSIFKDASEEDRAKLRPVALRVLAESEAGLLFHSRLMEMLFEDYVKATRYDLLEKLLEIPLVEDFQVNQMSDRIEEAAASLLNSNRSHIMNQFEAALKPAWCRSAIEKARIKVDIAAGDFEQALEKVDAFQDAAERRALRLLLIKQLLAANAG